MVVSDEIAFMPAVRPHDDNRCYHKVRKKHSNISWYNPFSSACANVTVTWHTSSSLPGYGCYAVRYSGGL